MMEQTYKQAGGLRVSCTLKDATGDTVEISEYIDFGFYCHVSYKENYGFGETFIVRWLWVSHRPGGLMKYWILTQNRTVTS